MIPMQTLRGRCGPELARAVAGSCRADHYHLSTCALQNETLGVTSLDVCGAQLPCAIRLSPVMVELSPPFQPSTRSSFMSMFGVVM